MKALKFTYLRSIIKFPRLFLKGKIVNTEAVARLDEIMVRAMRLMSGEEPAFSFAPDIDTLTKAKDSGDRQETWFLLIENNLKALVSRQIISTSLIKAKDYYVTNLGIDAYKAYLDSEIQIYNSVFNLFRNTIKELKVIAADGVINGYAVELFAQLEIDYANNLIQIRRLLHE